MKIFNPAAFARDLAADAAGHEMTVALEDNDLHLVIAVYAGTPDNSDRIGYHDTGLDPADDPADAQKLAQKLVVALKKIGVKASMHGQTPPKLVILPMTVGCTSIYPHLICTSTDWEAAKKAVGDGQTFTFEAVMVSNGAPRNTSVILEKRFPGKDMNWRGTDAEWGQVIISEIY